MTMTKKVLLPISFAVATVAIILGLVFSSSLPAEVTTAGRMVDLGNGQWGVRAEWNPVRPFRLRSYHLTTVASDFQVKNLRVQGTFQKTDVIGTEEWDAYFSVKSIAKK